MRSCCALLFLSYTLADYSRWLPPFNDASKTYALCTKEMDRLVLSHRFVSMLFMKKLSGEWINQLNST